MSYNAYLFIPISLIADEGGPIKIMPSCLQSSANSMFSERNPYPGWMAYKRQKAQPTYWLAELWCWHYALLWGDPDMANKTPRPLSWHAPTEILEHSHWNFEACFTLISFPTWCCLMCARQGVYHGVYSQPCTLQGTSSSNSKHIIHNKDVLLLLSSPVSRILPPSQT